MIARHQLAVRSSLSAAALARALVAAAGGDRSSFTSLAQTLREQLDARRVTFTDRGTSALVLALRMTAGAGGTVAYPGYSCVDLTAAAVRAGVQVRLYDLDPATLSPDLDSLERVLRRGVDALVVAHLYGYPGDMDGVLSLARRHGVPVIEDAAQAAGATYRQRPLGSFGDLTVLSFGRGKGTTGGHGGALVTRDPRWLEHVALAGGSLGVPRAGWSDLANAGAQWLLGRPGLYGIPASLPWLHLGEMVYRPVGEPRVMSTGAVALVWHSLAASQRETEVRRQRARHLEGVASGAVGVAPVRPLAHAVPGYLRLPVRETAGRRAAPSLGIVRAYPRSLSEQPELAPQLHAGERSGTGCAALTRTLFTLPTHGALTDDDVQHVRHWICSRPSTLEWRTTSSRNAEAPPAHAR